MKIANFVMQFPELAELYRGRWPWQTLEQVGAFVVKLAESIYGHVTSTLIPKMVSEAAAEFLREIDPHRPIAVLRWQKCDPYEDGTQFYQWELRLIYAPWFDVPETDDGYMSDSGAPGLYADGGSGPLGQLAYCWHVAQATYAIVVPEPLELPFLLPGTVEALRQSRQGES